MLSKLLSVSALAAAAQAVSISVAGSGGNATSPYAYGIMFEDINNSGDGGVYAELIQNRAFQGDSIYPKNLNYWNALGGAHLSLANLSAPLSAALPTSMQVTGGNGSSSTIGFSNVGFWGFPAEAGTTYKGSFYVNGPMAGNLTVCLTSYSNEAYAEAYVDVASTSGVWTQYNYTLTPSVSAPNANNSLNFTFAAADATGPVNFNLLSLFPPTYNNRENGLRIDLMDAMAGLYPSFFRAPGGNNAEGLRSPYWWNWTQTIGPLVDRPGYPDTWGYETTNGLGLIEYMLWAEDLGMEIVLALWDGLWLDGEVVPESGLDVYIQAALDELEFLTGDASTTYGAMREAMGYGPFSVNFVEIGNEDTLAGGQPAASYRAYRFADFYNAIKAVYPDMVIIASAYDIDGATPPFNASGDFHTYEIPYQMSQQFNIFDNYTDAHPILIGEYAIIEYNQPGTTGPSWYNGAPRALYPFWYGSIAEAVFLLGAERNSDKIIGAAYAPSFENYNRWEWIPDMIQYDAYPGNTVLGTTWYVLNLLSGTRITENLPMTITDGGFGPAYFVAGRSSVTGAHIAKFAVYNSTEDVPVEITFAGVGAGAVGNLTWLTAPMNASNSVGHQYVQSHTTFIRAGTNGTFSFNLPDYTVAVLDVGAQQAGYGHNYGNPGNRNGWKGWKQWGNSGVGGKNQWGQQKGHW